MEETPGFRELKQAREAQAQQAKAEVQRIDQMAKSASDFETNLSNLKTPFDEAMNSASNLAKSMTENGGNMVDDFLKGGDSASKLSDGLDQATDSVGKLSEEIKKSGPSPGGGARPGEGGKETGSLASIEKLLKKNFDELKAYAHAT
jgi:X-X-X-Leu-X-X-Gly heptad repeat protein